MPFNEGKTRSEKIQDQVTLALGDAKWTREKLENNCFIFLDKVYDVIRLCKLKFSHSLVEFLPVILTFLLIVSDVHSTNRV